MIFLNKGLLILIDFTMSLEAIFLVYCSRNEFDNFEFDEKINFECKRVELSCILGHLS